MDTVRRERERERKLHWVALLDTGVPTTSLIYRLDCTRHHLNELRQGISRPLRGEREWRQRRTDTAPLYGAAHSTMSFILNYFYDILASLGESTKRCVCCLANIAVSPPSLRQRYALSMLVPYCIWRHAYSEISRSMVFYSVRAR